ncbi:MAG: hypothetical protein LUD17_05025 [Bacteroidales bacterium]|nr:hypothetical protein [Bacteroidales bacterium]
MQQKEFESMTNIVVTTEDYALIEQLYYANESIDKQDFCKWFSKALSGCGDIASSLQYRQLLAIGAKLKEYEDEKRKAAQNRKRNFAILAEVAEKYSSPELREFLIQRMGAKEYLAWKLENGKSLWESDKQLLLTLLK